MSDNDMDEDDLLNQTLDKMIEDSEKKKNQLNETNNNKKIEDDLLNQTLDKMIEDSEKKKNQLNETNNNKKIEDDDDDDDFDEELEPSLKNIIEQKSLKWIFVGGKGGVGKTTTSCSLSVMLATQREKVLIISTDPAHNLSDAFGQQFGPKPRQIKGIKNLFAMEVDPKIDLSEVIASADDNELLESQSMSFLSELSSSIPGIDEAMSFAEIIKQVNKEDYSTIIFDTAPTGHTLRLLSFPTTLQKALTKLDGLRNKFGGLLGNIGNLMNANNNNNKYSKINKDQIFNKLQEMKNNVEKIKKQFENDDLTTFVCVCIPEFLSLYETERLAQQLAKFGIDTHNIVINQVLIPEKGSNCKRCKARVKMQQKYIEQFHDLYPDFHLVKVPLMSEEVRHIEKLKRFANLLLNPYDEMKEADQEKAIDLE